MYEQRFITPGGEKGVRYADAVEVTPEGKVVAIYQIGRVNQNGLVVPRESTAIADILQVSDGVPVTFLPYNSDIGPIIFD